MSFSLWWLLLLQSTGPRAHRLQQLWCTSLVAPWYEKTTSIFNTFSVLSCLHAYSLLWIQWPALYILVQLNHHLYTSSVSICLVSLLVYVLSPKPQYVQNLLILVFFPQPPPLVLKFNCDLRIYNNTKLITELLEFHYLIFTLGINFTSLIININLFYSLTTALL